jgi:hypothetical protein
LQAKKELKGARAKYTTNVTLNTELDEKVTKLPRQLDAKYNQIAELKTQLADAQKQYESCLDAQPEELQKLQDQIFASVRVSAGRNKCSHGGAAKASTADCPSGGISRGPNRRSQTGHHGDRAAGSGDGRTSSMRWLSYKQCRTCRQSVTTR